MDKLNFINDIYPESKGRIDDKSNLTWKYPSKNEFPEIGIEVLTHNTYVEEGFDLMKYKGDNKWELKNGDAVDTVCIQSWSYRLHS